MTKILRGIQGYTSGASWCPATVLGGIFQRHPVILSIYPFSLYLSLYVHPGIDSEKLDKHCTYSIL